MYTIKEIKESMAIIKAIAEGNKKLRSCLLLMFARFKLTKKCETIKVWWVQSRREIFYLGLWTISLTFISVPLSVGLLELLSRVHFFEPCLRTRCTWAGEQVCSAEVHQVQNQAQGAQRAACLQSEKLSPFFGRSPPSFSKVWFFLGFLGETSWSTTCFGLS